MSETKHTPGPWVAVKVEPKISRSLLHGVPPLFGDGVWWILPVADYERLPIATIDKANDRHAPTREQAEVDARLIAAAPELLAALSQIISDLPEKRKWLDPAVERYARAAIRKATEGQA